ncbi:hypothetical protein [Paraburkholderia sp. BCC1886]|uniref:DUF7193 family protein n=1 Tax=Paraburkholderia sp. BCC1886 TaxID=2562670 RepID=UPI00118245A4|nr:hypothetical protein [Paraburkholderia sp. BCC1886]
MFNYLVDNALKNVWCAPAQDRQGIFQLARLTPDGGVMNSVQVIWDSYTLPTSGVNFHVYQIGQVSPYMLGLLSGTTAWTTFTTAMNQNNLIADIYTESGIQLPRFQCYFRVMKNRNLIVAIQFESPLGLDMDTEAIFLRVYSNSFFASTRATLGATKNYIQTGGVVPALKSDITTIQNTIASLATLPGAVYCFLNGYKVTTINVATVALGDVVEYVYDSSIYKVIDFPYVGLPTFTSTKDSKFKYLLHYDGEGDGTIDFEKDIDVFLYYDPGTGNTQGVYYHHNQVDAIRNVTHRDYSLPTTYVQGYITEQTDWVAAANITVRLHIRKAGLDRPLLPENNRILDLYRLSDANIVSAMAGTNATLTNWQAATLEASPYLSIMGASPASLVTQDMVQDGYGYNRVSQLVGNSPLVPTLESGQLVVMLPYNLQSSSSIWEYDATGTLLGFYNHTSGGAYVCANPTCTLVEAFVGSASQQIDDTYGEQTQTLVAGLDYRMYTCPYDSQTGLPSYDWVDVTGSSNYSVVSNVLSWSVDLTTTYTCVRSNATILAYTLGIQPTEGILPIQLQEEAIRNYALQLFAMQIPMGQLDVFLNGRSLIQGLDYVMSFPEIMINTINALDFPQDKEQNITIRWTGFCDSTLTPIEYKDVGWVQYGLLSNNNQYNIRDDDVTRVVMGGGVFAKSALQFAEETTDILVPAAINGQPYQVQKIVVPMRSVTDVDTYTYLAESTAIDEAVEAYMTLYYPPTTASGPDTITALYPLFSPFCCKLIYDFVNDVIDETALQSFYNDDYVRTVCAPYEYLLAYDPTQSANAPDPTFTTIRPHNLSVTIALDLYAYRFITAAIRIYLNNKVSLGGFVSIAALGTSSAISTS